MAENNIKHFDLDFSRCLTVEDIYAVIKKELELPAWLGDNLSAFWDALTGMIEVPAVITFHKQVLNKELFPLVEALIAIAHRAEGEEWLGLVIEDK